MESKLPFGRRNYKLMIVGVLTLIIGFIIMSIDKEQHGFGFLGLTLGPIVVVAGFIIQFFAILLKPTK
jgi:uncharacterized membrane protein HdeD (DUF308 family)